MAFDALHDLLQSMFSRINISNSVPTPLEMWNVYGSEIVPLLTSSEPEVRATLVSLGSDIWLPKPLETARVLQNLRQRFNPGGAGKPLVGRIRAEAILKTRPKRDRERSGLRGDQAAIAKLAPSFTEFASFHLDGWERILGVIKERSSIVVVAPTGSGKTEVFLMPIIYVIAQSLEMRESEIPRFALLYPRVALLKDQLTRIFRYVYYAEQQYLSKGVLFDDMFGSKPIREGRGIIIGFQFGGIGSDADNTKNNPDIFDRDLTFRVLERCPICGTGKLKAVQAGQKHRQPGVTLLRCDNEGSCDAEFRTSISKNDHATALPHLLVLTAESLDRLYLNPTQKFENYLRQITGIVFDEVHLYYSLYGVHIYNLIRRIEELRGDEPLAKIASSATVSNPERFAAKLFYGRENSPVPVHKAADYDQNAAGLEVIYFLQSPEEGKRPGAAPTLIQSVMAIGHATLKDDDRTIIFTESLDMAGRLEAQIHNAETERWQDLGKHRGLWEFRTLLNVLFFRDQSCPRTNPANCPHLYMQGECWRGILGGRMCTQPIDGLRDTSLTVVQVSSQQQTQYWKGDVVVATAALEVGVDDERIKSTIHYLPPRTVFSFIQRRGRAGRKSGEIAYTLMVLGNTPSDNFYFFRRNRLINSSYELPLNPQNPIVRLMHDRLRDERQRMYRYINQASNSRQGIWKWIWETLRRCSLIDRYYGEQLAAQQVRSESDQRSFVRTWISMEKTNLESYLNLRWLLREIEDESPDELRDIAKNATKAVERFLTNQGMTAEEVSQQLEVLYIELGRLRLREKDREAKSRLQSLQGRVERIWDGMGQQTWGIELRHAERLYDFFRTLEGLYPEQKKKLQWVLNSAPDALKIVLQAMFYLHLGIEDNDEPDECPSRIDYFIPQAYFQVVKPIIVEVRYEADKERTPDLHQEDVTSSSTLLIPYKPIYRYHSHPFLSIVDTEHDPAWVNNDQGTITVRLRLRTEGLRRESVLVPQKFYVKPLRGDDQGQQIVNICPQCYAIYNINRARPCHESLRAVKLYSEPIVRRNYDVSTVRQITRTLRLFEGMQGTTTVFGADVRASIVINNKSEYTITSNLFREFRALYEAPVRYSLSTNGIAWTLADIVQRVLQDENVRRQVGQVLINGKPKILDEKLILHTAAHMLQKAVASISGVNEQLLEYWYDTTLREVVIWERYEGGAGISEIFETALRTNPVKVYSELLASVICLIDLAERTDWASPENLQARLTDRWNLSSDNETIGSIVQEAWSEKQAQSQRQGEENRLVCRPPEGSDGCPVCMHTTYCTERNGQSLTISRLAGEAILYNLVRHINHEKFEALVADSTLRGIAQPTVLSVDKEQQIYTIFMI